MIITKRMIERRAKQNHKAKHPTVDWKDLSKWGKAVALNKAREELEGEK